MTSNYFKRATNFKTTSSKKCWSIIRSYTNPKPLVFLTYFLNGSTFKNTGKILSFLGDHFRILPVGMFIKSASECLEFTRKRFLSKLLPGNSLSIDWFSVSEVEKWLSRLDRTSGPRVVGIPAVIFREC